MLYKYGGGTFLRGSHLRTQKVESHTINTILVDRGEVRMTFRIEFLVNNGFSRGKIKSRNNNNKKA